MNRREVTDAIFAERRRMTACVVKSVFGGHLDTDVFERRMEHGNEHGDLPTTLRCPCGRDVRISEHDDHAKCQCEEVVRR